MDRLGGAGGMRRLDRTLRLDGRGWWKDPPHGVPPGVCGSLTKPKSDAGYLAEPGTCGDSVTRHLSGRNRALRVSGSRASDQSLTRDFVLPGGGALGTEESGGQDEQDRDQRDGPVERIHHGIPEVC